MFIQALKKTTSVTKTVNGAKTYETSGDVLFDFFAVGGACRDNVFLAKSLFIKAYEEDKESALRVLFYLRDVRGGQGERSIFKSCLRYVYDVDREVFRKVFGFVSEYGRWDDIFDFSDDEEVSKYIRKQIISDWVSETPSLLAKWLPTINASSQKTRKYALSLVKNLGVHPISYRKVVRSIRKKLNIVEHKMSARNWGDVNYETVPSVANKVYSNAFLRHDEERRNSFLEDVIGGKKKMNSSALYPHQIYTMVENGKEETANALWKSLPDYTTGENALVMADVSGSMSGTPMAVSVSLALYFAERNIGVFNGYFMTFSERPQLVKIFGDKVAKRMKNIERSHWGANTNVNSALDSILNAAIVSKATQEEMPKVLYIISDMEFDDSGADTNHETAKQKFEEAGYSLPSIVYWNVDAKDVHFPVYSDEYNTYLISGRSPTVFKIVLEGKSQRDIVDDIVNSDRYKKIKL
jgi:hypothetical protein